MLCVIFCRVNDNVERALLCVSSVILYRRISIIQRVLRARALLHRRVTHRASARP